MSAAEEQRPLLWGSSPALHPLETSSRLETELVPRDTSILSAASFLAFPVLVKFCLPYLGISMIGHRKRNLEIVLPLLLKVVTFAHVCQRKCL